ncbi:MAG: hypothetical protein ABIS06_00405 [Vicinamibacterales bacterium]
MEPTRRQVVQLLVSLGAAGAVTTDLSGQAPNTLSLEDVKGALAIQRRDLQAQEMALVQRALQRSLDEFQRVRELDINDAVALPVIFRPGRG